VGLFWFRRIEEHGGAVLLSTGGFFLDDDGLAYLPGPLPPTWPEFTFWHVRDRWWRYHWDD
jgi:hypothetical protein